MINKLHNWEEVGVWVSCPGEGQETQTPRAPRATLRHFLFASYFDGIDMIHH